MVIAMPKSPSTDVGGIEFKKAGISESEWEYKFISGDEKWAKPSLRFTTDEFIHPYYCRPT